jgi:hypothetical protein
MHRRFFAREPRSVPLWICPLPQYAFREAKMLRSVAGKQSYNVSDSITESGKAVTA